MDDDTTGIPTADGRAGLPWAPDACTLPIAERPLRVAEFDSLFASSLRAIERPERTRLRLVLDTSAEAVARDLAARETSCCSFFAFDFAPAGDRLVLDVGVPSAYVGVLDAMADGAAVAAGLSV